ncbi:FliA/WhiG family RNA polymerase sigma factor [Candidatus Oleimmundimicrobium sp.]|uniref:FliA/WhiG family RNA polymerase sigma factor n=1 Tax=Candidatus Oleimmundimicrobium sp. TaxID=3060597 RepID=UPI002719AB24|nr:FliA/WhiG family RNA polymerase sigma factor [Candidatus Oleimmundimicrobium sp.]MDO8885894.1 FliA/WhiG family RNA polymerase sigma factor [Candidatus Oleimmundimicrobium sp.]
MEKFKPQSEWEQYKIHGDTKARERLIVQYLPLVKYVVERMGKTLPSDIETDDLISYGIIGLIDAIEKFDYHRGIKFGTYAVPRIKGAIIDELRISDHAPRSFRQKAKKLMEAYTKVEKRLGHAPKNDEVAEELNMDIKYFNNLLCEVSKISLLSLESFVTKNEDSKITIGDKLNNNEMDGPSDFIELKDIKDILAKSIENLTEQEQIVIALYYYDGFTLKKASKVLNLSESRVSQIRTKAVLRLREQLSHLRKEDAL